VRDAFPTLVAPGTGLHKAKGSKFHGYAFPLPFADEAAAEAAVTRHLEAVKADHHAARHVCFAWQFGPQRFRAADDGEPAGSAGAPIHGVLRSHDLHWTLIAVVRYFGGIKLGVGGLIDAYRSAGQEAVENAGITESLLMSPLTLFYPPDLTRHVMQAIQKEGAHIVAEGYTNRCQLDIQVRAGSIPSLSTELEHIHGVEIKDPHSPPSS
jgi:putative IMPACT (imprinted ancient) family translation regulator